MTIIRSESPRRAGWLRTGHRWAATVNTLPPSCRYGAVCRQVWFQHDPRRYLAAYKAQGWRLYAYEMYLLTPTRTSSTYVSRISLHFLRASYLDRGRSFVRGSLVGMAPYLATCTSKVPR